MKAIHLIPLAILLVLASFLAGRWTGEKAPQEPVKARTDTLLIRDTIRVAEPVEIAHTVVKEKQVEIPVYIHTRDTVIREVWVPREERIYQDSSYFAVVSGVDPRLDYLEINRTERVVTQTVTERSRPRWSLGVQAGYGACKDGLTPYIGVGLQWNIVSFGHSFKQ